jgi:hypothetical protein
MSNHPIFANPTVCIDRIEDRFHASLYAGDLSLEVQFPDAEGDMQTLCINSTAIRDLAEKLHEAQEAILQAHISQSKAISFDVISGPTRGEIYFPEGEL